jgi:hypothetical protein
MFANQVYHLFKYYYMKLFRFVFLIVICTSFSPQLKTKELSPVKNFAEVKKVNKVFSFYQSIQSHNFNLPNFETFCCAFKGFENLQANGKIQNNLLTIIDFLLSSAKNRL